MSTVGGGCRVVLVGMMGSGKTTVGRLLAAQTGWPRYDNDELLFELYGMTPKQILEARGEDALRAAEDAALAYGLERPAPCIIDAAAGTILSAGSRAALTDPVVVWLRASPATLFGRALGATHRPWLDGGEQWMRETDTERSPLYASVADVSVVTDDRTPNDIADEALAEINELCRARAAPGP
jgi:shikimate kinase